MRSFPQITRYTNLLVAYYEGLYRKLFYMTSLFSVFCGRFIQYRCHLKSECRIILIGNQLNWFGEIASTMNLMILSKIICSNTEYNTEKRDRMVIVDCIFVSRLVNWCNYVGFLVLRK